MTTDQTSMTPSTPDPLTTPITDQAQPPPTTPPQPKKGGRPKGCKDKTKRKTRSDYHPKTPITSPAPPQNNQLQPNLVNQKPLDQPKKPDINDNTNPVNVTTKIETTTEDQARELQIAVQEQGQNLKRLINTIFQASVPNARAQVCDFISGLSEGIGWSDLSGVTGLSSQMIAGYCRQYPLFSSLIYAAKDAGEQARRQKREEIAHNHAVNGTEKPVFQQGVEVGRIREFDHRLLEFLLKADNPGKYRDQPASVNIQANVTSVIVQKHRD